MTLPTVAMVGYVVTSLRDSRRHESRFAILKVTQFDKQRDLSVPKSTGRRGLYKTIRI